MVAADARHPALALPRWAYLAGVEGEADHATLARAKALVPARFASAVPADHPALRYGLALNDAGFFWEAHEILEAVWKAAPQGGRDRILLRACIQIVNANLKSRLQQPRAVARLLAEALAELDELGVRAAGVADDGFAERFPAALLASALRARGSDPAVQAGPICLAIDLCDMKQNAEF